MKAGRLKLVVSICLALLLVILSLSVACAKPAPAQTLEIGALVSLTGPGSETDILLLDGAQLAADWINDKGGITIGGQKYLIKLIAEDIKSTADGTVAAAIKLVEQDKVKFVIGPMIPFMVDAAETVTGPAKVLRCMLIGAATPGEISPERPYHFRAWQGIAWCAKPCYDYLLETYPDVKTVAFMAADEPGGHYMAEQSKKLAEERGLTIVATEFFPWGTEDFYPMWTKVLATKPDAVDMGAATILWAGSLLKQGRELGFTGPCWQISTNDLYTIRDIVGTAGSTNFWNPSWDLASPKMPSMMKEIAKLWQAKYGVSLQGRGDGVFGWDAVWCMTQAIEEAQSLDPTVVAQTWEKMTHIETAFGSGKMGGLKTDGVNHSVVRPVSLTRLNKGEVEFVGWFTVDIP